jgi:DNA-binding winged helix-turn-helix (wHTH) protein
MVRQVFFGSFTIDFDTRELLRDDSHERVHLSPKAYELLCVLVENRPKAIAKADLHERLWPDSFVSEATLASLIAELREALGEHGREARYIRTVHGFGYAFAHEAREIQRADLGRIASWIVCNGREQPLGDGAHVIGRDADAALALKSPTVSRRHARIVIAGGVATLEDLDSKNGTRIGDQAVNNAVALSDGDQIHVGPVMVIYHASASGVSTETVVRK